MKPDPTRAGAATNGPVTSFAAATLRLFDGLLFWTSAALLLGIVVVLGLQVFYRYVLNDSLTWTDEVSRLLLVWLVCLGAGLASFRGRHLRLEFLEDRLPIAGAWAARATISALTVWFMWVVLEGNADVIEVRAGIPFTSIPISSEYLAYAISVGAVLVIIGSIVDLFLRRPTRA